MEKNLLSISDLIKNGWQLYLDNFPKFLLPIGLMIPPYVLLYLAEYLNFLALPPLMFLIMALMIFINLWMSILIIEMINKLFLKQEVQLNSLFESSFKKIPSYLLVAILVALIVFGGIILFIIPGIIFSIWYSFAPYVNLLEDKNNKGRAALKSSKELVQGRWWGTFIRLVLPTLLIYCFVIVIIFCLTYAIAGGNLNFDSMQQSLTFDLLYTAVILILSPLFAAFNVILYNNLKETKNSTLDNSQSIISQ